MFNFQKRKKKRLRDRKQKLFRSRLRENYKPGKLNYTKLTCPTVCDHSIELYDPFHCQAFQSGKTVASLWYSLLQKFNSEIYIYEAV